MIYARKGFILLFHRIRFVPLQTLGIQGPFRLVHAWPSTLTISVYYCTYIHSDCTSHSYTCTCLLTTRLLVLVLHCSPSSHRHTSRFAIKDSRARLAPTIQSNLQFPRRSDLYSFDYYINYASAGLAYLLARHGGIGIELDISWILSLDWSRDRDKEVSRPGQKELDSTKIDIPIYHSIFPTIIYIVAWPTFSS